MGTYKATVVISFSQIDSLTIYVVSLLSLVTVFILKSILSYITTAASLFFCFPLCGIPFSIPLIFLGFYLVCLECVHLPHHFI